MSSLSEDEVLDTLTWSDESYTLAEFINEHTLPQVVRVVRGHDGGTDSSTIGYGEILTLHALRETHKLTAEDSNGNAISIAFDCPYKFNVLPQTKDCSFNSCGVENVLSCYPKVKYLEVLQAHYGMGGDGEESTSVGELLEILSIDKRQRTLKVKNIETEQTFMLPSTCTAAFRPLLDWKSYCAQDFKAQLDFPTRIRFLQVETDSNEADRDEKLYHKLLSKTPDVNVVGEIEEVLVITTTVGSCTDLKFCYEIPSDLEIQVAVADGFSSGNRYYQEVVTNLDKGFDVAKFMSTQQPAFLKNRENIKQHDYESIPELYINIFREVSSGKVEEEAPALPPRRPLSESKSVPVYVTSPITRSKPPAQLPKPLTSTNNNTDPKPAVKPPQPRPKSAFVKSHSTNKAPPPNIPQKPPSNLKDTHNDHPDPPKTPPPPSPKPGSKSPSAIDSIPSVPTTLPPGESNANLPAVSKPEETKPTPVRPSEPVVILPKPVPPRRIKVSKPSSEVKPPIREPEAAIHESAQPQQPPVTSPKGVTGWTLPGLNEKSEQSTHLNEPPMISPKSPPSRNAQTVSPAPPEVPRSQSNNPDESQRVPIVSPLDKPPFPSPKKADWAPPNVTPKLSPTPSRIPTDPTTAKQDDRGESVLKKADAKPDGTNEEATQCFESETPAEETSKDDDYEELEPPAPAKIVVKPTTTSDTPKQTEIPAYSQSNTWTVVTEGSPGTGWETEDPYAAVARIPEDLSGLSVSEVSQLLKHLRMECYAERFAEEMIDGKLLKSLQEDELLSLNVSSFHCKKLVKFINGWRPVQ